MRSTRLPLSKHKEEISRHDPFDPTASNRPNSQITDIGGQKYDNKADTIIIIKVAVEAI